LAAGAFQAQNGARTPSWWVLRCLVEGELSQPPCVLSYPPLLEHHEGVHVHHGSAGRCAKNLDGYGVAARGAPLLAEDHGACLSRGGVEVDCGHLVAIYVDLRGAPAGCFCGNPGYVASREGETGCRPLGLGVLDIPSVRFAQGAPGALFTLRLAATTGIIRSRSTALAKLGSRPGRSRGFHQGDLSNPLHLRVHGKGPSKEYLSEGRRKGAPGPRKTTLPQHYLPIVLLERRVLIARRASTVVLRAHFFEPQGGECRSQTDAAFPYRRIVIASSCAPAIEVGLTKCPEAVAFA
jgi:hypothetical protein